MSLSPTLAPENHLSRAATRTPFDTIESAEEFLYLLQQETQTAVVEIRRLLDETEPAAARRVEALPLVLHKLSKLQVSVETSQRTLSDLRTLRGLLLR